MTQIFNENHNQDIVRPPKTSTPKKSKNIFRPKKSSAPKLPKISEATSEQASQNSQVVDVEVHTPPANPPENSQVIDVGSHTPKAIPPENSQVIDVGSHTPKANPPENSQVIDVESYTPKAIPPPPPRKIKDEPQDLIYVDGQFKKVPREKSSTTTANLMTFTPSKGLILI